MSDGAASAQRQTDTASENLPRNLQYAIHRVPNLMTVTPGAQVRYTCDYKLGKLPEAIGGPSQYRDGVRWYKFRERALLEETRGKDPQWAVPIQKGPVGQFFWDHRWEDEPGRYVVASEISNGSESSFCFLGQYVEAAGLVVERSLEDLLAGGPGPSPADAERSIAQQLAGLEAIEKRFPIANPEDKRKHDKAVANWKKYQEALRKVLALTDGKIRIAVRAMHLEAATQQRRPLLLFLCHVEDVAQGRSARKRPRWVLVDWTDPTDTRFHGTYEGMGETAEEAIRNALSDWDWGNRYPEGQLSYELPAHAFGRAQRYEMATNGKSLGDEVKGIFEWVAIGGMVVAGALLLFTTVPALAAAALGTSLLSSTAAAGISIGQRWRAGIFDWREDAFDGLTIIGNLFAAGAGAWVRGARVIVRGKNGERLVRVFFGAQIGTDVVQGVLVAEQSLREWNEFLENPDLLPEDRARKLLELFRSLATAGLLTYMSLRATGAELENLNKKPRHLPDEGQARAPSEKLADLTNPERTVDTTKPPIVEGHTKEGTHKTTVKTGVAAHPKTIEPHETEFAKTYEDKGDGYWRERVIRKDKIVLKDNEGYYFNAFLERGELVIQIMTVRYAAGKTPKYSKIMMAKQLYPMMYRHFEAVGNPVKRLRAIWDEKNFEDAKRVYDQMRDEGKPHQEAVNEAVRFARSYAKYHEPEGMTKLIEAKSSFETDQFDVVFERE